MASRIAIGEFVIRKRIIEGELLVDVLRNIIGKRLLNSRDEEILLDALFPSEQPIPPSWCLGSTAVESEKDIPGLKALVEKELTELFDDMDRLDKVAGIGEMDASFEHEELKSSASSLKKTSQTLLKQYKTLHTLGTVDFLSPLLNSIDTLSSSTNEVHRQLKEMENEIMKEIFSEATGEELENNIANPLEEHLKALTSRLSAIYEELDKYQEDREDLLSVAKFLNEVEEEIEFKKAAVQALDCSLVDCFEWYLYHIYIHP